MIAPSDLALARERVAGALGITLTALDRVAAALALNAGRAGTRTLELGGDDLDAFESGAVFSPLGSPPGADGFGRLLATGYQLLLTRIEVAGDDPLAAVSALIREVRTTGHRARVGGGVTVPVGKAGSRSIVFTLNQESGHQTNGNTRITGEQGMGKSQFLLHLLAASATRAPAAGFLLLDYKGDLSTEANFVRATDATVIRPERDPVPINPFDVPPGIDRRLVPAAIARVVSSVARQIGEVQRKLLRDGIRAAYESSAPDAPTTTQIAEAVDNVYRAEGRATDSVSGVLEELAELGLFATRTESNVEAFLRQRWIVDLSGLQHLRDLVAFVIVGWLSRNVQSLADSALLPGGYRELRHIVAVDEAHHYVKRRCEPLLDLLRIGRSKGVPIFLSSQSLSDFRGFTELEELLPNNFVLRHGRAPDTKTVQGALRLPAELARRAGDAITSVPQFHALTAVDPNLQLQPVELHGFFAGRWGSQHQT
jgi:hypothetical protein